MFESQHPVFRLSRVTDRAPRYDDASKRRQRILSALRSSGFASVTELARSFGVSGMTIRRDLQKLEERGEARVVRGGVSLPEGALLYPAFGNRAGSNTEEKRRIARRAGELVAAADSIAVDAGTTTHALAGALPEDYTGCVVTPSVPVIHQLMSDRPEVRVVGLGGDLLRASEAFAGPMTVDAAARVRVRLFFLGAAAVDARGVYVNADTERPTKLALMAAADEVVLLADHTKFAARAPVRLSELARLTAVVTDRMPAAEICGQLAAAGVRLLVGAE